MAIPDLKERICEMAVEEWRGIALRCLDLSTAAEVEAILDDHIGLEEEIAS